MSDDTVTEARLALRNLQDAAALHRTPCGAGHMVWHDWPCIGAGDTSAPVLVLLHGGSGSWTHWLRNIPDLRHRFRVLAADTPGLGDSDMPPGVFSAKDYPAGMRMLAEVFVDGLDEILGPDASFHLAGFSMGAIAGAYTAARAGARAMSFTLVGASAFGLAWEGLAEPLHGMTDTMTEAERIDVQRRNLQIIMTHAEADDFAGYLQLRNVERARIRSHGLPHTDTLMQALPAIVAPVAGIWGRQDVYARPSLAHIENLLRDCRPELKFRVIANAGHWVMYEGAAAFTPALIEVIEGAAGRAQALSGR